MTNSTAPSPPEITELYRVHRPVRFQDVVGQDDAVRVLTSLGKGGRIPHALLFTGPSGCGKTTLARIVAAKLKCGDMDFAEVNCADFRGIDMVRDIRNRLTLAPIGGKSRVWLIDESHKLSGDAQNAFLKMLEDTPGHVYFFLATTDPLKLLPTIRTRCTEIKVKELSPAHQRTLLKATAVKEGAELSEEVEDQIIKLAEGSARKAMVLLNQIIALSTDEERLGSLEASNHQGKAIELARALLNPNAQWMEVAALLKGIEEEPESLRYMVLGYARNVALGGGKMTKRAMLMIDAFSDNFYDSKAAGLARACYEVVVGFN